jgi:hypothetical protein
MAVCGWEFPDKVCCGQHLGHAGDHVRWGGKSSQDTDLEARGPWVLWAVATDWGFQVVTKR